MANEQESAELRMLLGSDTDQQGYNIGGFFSRYLNLEKNPVGWICLGWSRIQLHHAL